MIQKLETEALAIQNLAKQGDEGRNYLGDLEVAKVTT